MAERLSDPAWLAAEYAEKTGTAIAEELGCSSDRVYEALHAAGIPPHKPGHYPPPNEITPETEERILSLYLAGSSAKRIAADLGLSDKRVLRVVEEQGARRPKSGVASLAYAARPKPKPEKEPAKPRRRWMPELEPEVLERYAAGEAGEVIAP